MSHAWIDKGVQIPQIDLFTLNIIKSYQLLYIRNKLETNF